MDPIYNNDNVTTNNSEVREVGHFWHDFHAVLADAQAIPEAELVQPTTDAATATGAIFQKLPQLEELRPRAEKLPEFSMYEYDQLGPRARALSVAEAQHKMAVTPPVPIDNQLELLMLNKNLLLGECHLLILRGCIPAEPVEALKFTTGHRHTAINARNLIVYLISNWEAVSPHTSMSLEDLDAMAKVADEVDLAVSQREAQPRQIAKATLVRRQIFTLVFRSLGEVDRAVYFFHKDRMGDFMPAVYTSRAPRRELAEDAAVEEPATPVVAAPVAPAPVAPAAPIPPGMPGSSPFIR